MDRHGLLVDRIARGAHVPLIASADTLRLELDDHFAEALAEGRTPEEAVAAFGDEEGITAAFRRVYCFELLVWATVKWALCIAVATAAALAFMSLMGAGVDSDGSIFGRRFMIHARSIFKLSLAGAIAWELARRPLTIPRVLSGLAVYAVAAVTLQMLARGGFHHWHFWNTPIVAVAGVLCLRLRRSWLWLVLTFVAFVATMGVLIALQHPRWLTATRAVTDGLFLYGLEGLVAWSTLVAVRRRVEDRLESPAS